MNPEPRKATVDPGPPYSIGGDFSAGACSMIHGVDLAKAPTLRALDAQFRDLDRSPQATFSFCAIDDAFVRGSWHGETDSR